MRQPVAQGQYRMNTVSLPAGGFLFDKAGLMELILKRYAATRHRGRNRVPPLCL